MNFTQTKAAIETYKKESKKLNDTLSQQETARQVNTWLKKWKDLDEMVAMAYWQDTIDINSKENCMLLTAEGTINYLKIIGQL